MCGDENPICAGVDPALVMWFVCCGWLVPTVILPPGGTPIKGWEFINES